MSAIDVLKQAYEFNRGRTLATLAMIEKDPNPQEVLGWRPGEGRAHIAWQLMHIGVTEEIFATERLSPERTGGHRDLWARFRGGSTPDENIPTPAEIRDVLDTGRRLMLETLSEFDESRLDEIPAALAERKWTVRTALNVIAWHEGHHQGQAHITFNLFKGQHR